MAVLKVLGGNYGILYRVRVRTQSGDGRNLGFLFNPRGKPTLKFRPSMAPIVTSPNNPPQC